MKKFTVGLIQMNARNEMEPNIAFIEEQTRKACAAGASFVMTPENSALLGANQQDTLSKVVAEERHPGLASARALAREHGIWFLIGSIHVQVEGGERCANRSYVIDPQGTVVAWYDKIHMFDAELPSGERYLESAVFRPGERAVVARTPWGGLGMGICYDMRFAYLQRALAQADATMLSFPSSFTVPTGSAHWHVLLRARAIETGCFVFAPAQVGTHAGGRSTYGHSVVIGPWGEVLADAGGSEPGFITAEIDLGRVDEVRRALPSLRHDRRYGGPELPGPPAAGEAS